VFVPRAGGVSLVATDFRWFSTDPPGPITLNQVAWVLPEPGQPGHDGKLGVNDAVSLRSYALGTLSFLATFVNGTRAQGHPRGFSDELVVFAASDVTTYQGYEFGVRLSLSDGFVYGYWQSPLPTGGVLFKEHRLFANDGRSHQYSFRLAGGAISYSVDGTQRLTEFYPTIPISGFYVVATAHRASEGWSDAGLALSVADLSVDPVWL